ncbi:MAG: hypothetical protein ACRER2_09775 [Methylococcales bacterium]
MKRIKRNANMIKYSKIKGLQSKVMSKDHRGTIVLVITATACPAGANRFFVKSSVLFCSKTRIRQKLWQVNSREPVVRTGDILGRFNKRDATIVSQGVVFFWLAAARVCV